MAEPRDRQSCPDAAEHHQEHAGRYHGVWLQADREPGLPDALFLEEADAQRWATAVRDDPEDGRGAEAQRMPAVARVWWSNCTLHPEPPTAATASEDLAPRGLLRAAIAIERKRVVALEAERDEARAVTDELLAKAKEEADGQAGRKYSPAVCRALARFWARMADVRDRELAGAKEPDAR